MAKKPGDPWGVMHSIAGAPLYLEHESPVDPGLISAFSSVIVNYCRILFGASPARLVFGGSGITAMDFIATDKNVFVNNNTRKLFSLERFVRKWKNIPPKIIRDLAPSMETYFEETLVQVEKERLKEMEFHQIINRFTRMGIRRAKNYQIPED